MRDRVGVFEGLDPHFYPCRHCAPGVIGCINCITAAKVCSV